LGLGIGDCLGRFVAGAAWMALLVRGKGLTAWERWRLAVLAAGGLWRWDCVEDVSQHPAPADGMRRPATANAVTISCCYLNALEVQKAL